LLYRVAAK